MNGRAFGGIDPSVMRFLVRRGGVDTECFVEEPVELPNRPSDTETFSAIWIGAKMVAAWSQHQLRAALGADMQKR
jgi:hypothetical protein